LTRGVLWMVWGSTPALVRSRASASYWHPELAQHVVNLPEDSTVLAKSRMFDLSPFDETLFLDADTTVLGRLDYGFNRASVFGMALTHSANPWQRRYYKLKCEPDAAEYSSGVIFFDRRASVKRLFGFWTFASGRLDSRCKYVDGGEREQLHNDQGLMSYAIEKEGLNPFVLPQNWNFVPRWQKQFFGPLKVWHGSQDIPKELLEWNTQQSQPEAVIQCTSLP
jgi:hypothetical protein